MTRNQQIVFISLILTLFLGLSIGIFASMHDGYEYPDLTEPALDVDAYMAGAPTVPQCYVNYGAMTYQVDCNSQSMVDAKRRYDQHVQEQIQNFDKTP